MARRRSLQIALAILALFLLGTFVVLSTVSFYLRIAPEAYLSLEELVRNQAKNATSFVPRILHQTWKDEVIPEKWANISQNCRDIMPDYEYMLWTDDSSREFLSEHYPWFLNTFDGYPYNIQRADAIRYFVLHHYGGVYLDLDVGCNKRLDSLLTFKVVLPKTIPVGVSNDLMFAEKNHPFMEQTIHNLVTFDHSWVLNYPTVMFSTGPMFLSAQLGLYAAAHQSDNDVRVLPKSLYGKNAAPGTAPDAFFAHYYGSSWHADDAGFITFLGKWGTLLLYIGSSVLLIGTLRLLYTRFSKNKSHGHSSHRSRRRLLVGRYDIILPQVSHRNGAFQFDLGSFSLASETQPSSPTSPTSLSPLSSSPSSPLLENGRIPLLPFGPDSPLPAGATAAPGGAGRGESSAARAIRNARAWVRTSLVGEGRLSRTRPSNGRRRRSTLFFLPAIFTPSSTSTVRLHDQDEVEMPFVQSRPSLSSRASVSVDKKLRADDFNLAEEDNDGVDIALHPPRRSRSPSSSPSHTASSSGRIHNHRGAQSPPTPLQLGNPSVERPPPYQPGQLVGGQTPHSAWSTAWGEWEGDVPR